MGTTWVERGPAYWVRRVVAAGLMFLALAVAAVITGSLVGAIATSDVALPVKGGALLVVACAVGYSFVRAFSAFVRVERIRAEGELFRPGFRAEQEVARSRRLGEAGGIAAALVQAGAGILLVISVVFCFGWFVVLFLWSLQREFGIERDARIRYEQRKSGSGPCRGGRSGAARRGGGAG